MVGIAATGRSPDRPGASSTRPTRRPARGRCCGAATVAAARPVTPRRSDLPPRSRSRRRAAGRRRRGPRRTDDPARHRPPTRAGARRARRRGGRRATSPLAHRRARRARTAHRRRRRGPRRRAPNPAATAPSRVTVPPQPRSGWRGQPVTGQFSSVRSSSGSMSGRGCVTYTSQNGAAGSRPWSRIHCSSCPHDDPSWS